MKLTFGYNNIEKNWKGSPIYLILHRVDGFSLSWDTMFGTTVTERYIGYSVAEAKRMFKELIRNKYPYTR